MRPTRVFAGDVRDLRESGMPDEDIAWRLGCSREYVGRLRKRLGLPSRQRRWTPADTERLQHLHAAGRNLIDIAETLGRTVFSVRDRIRKLQGKKL